MFSFAIAMMALLPHAVEMPDTLEAAAVVTDRGVVVSRTDTVSANDIPNIGDLLDRIPGMLVVDCGGAAGLKTVSMRGLGSAHTAIYVDGVRVGNVQSGQPDLGMLPFESTGAVVVDYAQNSISFNSARPVFRNGPAAGSFRLRGGSFGSFEPSGRIDFRLSDRISVSAVAAGTFSRGDYPYGDGMVRTNNDISLGRGGVDVMGLTDGGDWHAKAYVNVSDRGTPGSADFPSSDRQKDANAFVQAVFRKHVSRIYHLNVSAKAAGDRVRYLSEWGDSEYLQTDLQLNSSHEFTLGKGWKASIAADMQYDGLKSTLYEASRFGIISAAAASFRSGRLAADVAVEYDGTFDRTEGSWNTFSPSAGVRLSITDDLDVSAFGRRAYRVPTFNELYYPGYGNPALEPEDAWLADAGVMWSRRTGSGWKLDAKADFFLNILSDRISSAPSVENPGIWRPFNIGKVVADGVEAYFASKRTKGPTSVGFSARYAFQNATDRTEGSDSYGRQVAYIPEHSLFLSADFCCRGWSATASMSLNCGCTDSYGTMPDRNVLNLILGKEICIGTGGRLGFRLMLMNALDCRYELSRGYPMPGRSLTGGLEYRF